MPDGGHMYNHADSRVQYDRVCEWCIRWGASRVGWQVKLCDPTWQATLRSSEMGSNEAADLNYHRLAN